MACPVFLQWNSSAPFTHGLIQSFIPTGSGLRSICVERGRCRPRCGPALTLPASALHQNEPAPLPVCPLGVRGSADPWHHQHAFSTSSQLGSALRQMSALLEHLPTAQREHCHSQPRPAAPHRWGVLHLLPPLKGEKALVTPQRATGLSKVGFCARRDVQRRAKGQNCHLGEFVWSHNKASCSL